MLVPLVLGYVVGAVGIYTLLYKLSPVTPEDKLTLTHAPQSIGSTDVIELFPRRQNEFGGNQKAA